MEPTSWGWLFLFTTLLITTIGIFWLIILIFTLIVLLVGFLSVLYVSEGQTNKPKLSGSSNFTQNSNGIPSLIGSLPLKAQKYDQRITGSELIDSSLQEILSYLLRDYVHPWYDLISEDQEFCDSCIRKTVQSLAINVSNRVKNIDWIPYLTTRLVDDAATHLRLYRQAKSKVKQFKDKNNETTNHLLSPKKINKHKRNKSDTDVRWRILSDGNDQLQSDKPNQIESDLTLEEHFFHLECQLENKLICRDAICLDKKKETDFLCELMEILMYILLPEEDFQCSPLRSLLREIAANCVVQPLIEMLSSPDYINEAIMYIYMRDTPMPGHLFLTVLRTTDHCGELNSTKELILKEIQQLRSRDTGGDSGLSIKQQLSSLLYVLKLIDNKISKIAQHCDHTSVHKSTDLLIDSQRSVDLNLGQILKSNIALSFFIDFILTNGKQADLFFYLNIESWKSSADNLLSELRRLKLQNVTTYNESASKVYTELRRTASEIFTQYLVPQKQLTKTPDSNVTHIDDEIVKLPQDLVQQTHARIRNISEELTEFLFDDIKKYLYQKMDAEYLPHFKSSRAYQKLLQELDLVPQPNSSQADEDTVSINSNDSGGGGAMADSNSSSPTSKVPYSNVLLPVDSRLLAIRGRHVRSLSDVAPLANHKSANATTCDVSKDSTDPIEAKTSASNNMELNAKALKFGPFSIGVNIIETGIMREKGQTFGIYAMHVSYHYELSGYLEEWHIYRRYSDFYDLHTKVKERYGDLAKIVPFPGKKAFHNMDRRVLERRMRMLGTYMDLLCQPGILKTHPGLRNLLSTFLEQGEYDRATCGPISATINSLKSGMKSIKHMPEQLITTVDEVVGGISKVFRQGGKASSTQPETSKVGASIEETDDNIPLRIMLLLMDEVFDLKSRNQWLRRRIVTLLRQIIRTMFGDIVNRRILDYVSLLTSPQNVAQYLHMLKKSLWPNGQKYERSKKRDESTRCRARVVAKVALLSCVTDELKHIIGSETSRKGVLTIFEMFQRPILNRRLLYVLLEGVLRTLLPETDMTLIYQRLHSKSDNVKAESIEPKKF